MKTPPVIGDPSPCYLSVRRTQSPQHLSHSLPNLPGCRSAPGSASSQLTPSARGILLAIPRCTGHPTDRGQCLSQRVMEMRTSTR